MVRVVVVIAILAAFGGGIAAGALTDRGGNRSTRLHLDLRVDRGRAAPFLRRFDLAALNTGAAPDQIRSIDRPIFDTPAQARALLPASSLVVGLARGGQARAYPIDLLSLHEVVNDLVGGTPVAITWCPLCSSALAFDRHIRGRVLTFGISGLLYHANQNLFDRQTRSLWSQLAGGAVTGRMRGTPLRPIPLVETTWGKWLHAHPHTLVLSIRRDSRAYDFTHSHSFATHLGEEVSDQPYGNYTDKVSFYFGRRVRGIVDGSRVLGVIVRGQAKAYPVALLRRRRAIDDVVAHRPILLTYDDGALTGAAFSRGIRGRTLTFRPAGSELVDRQTGTRWSAATGRGLSGPLAGVSLPRLPSTVPYWFAWRAFHPDTAVAR